MFKAIQHIANAGVIHCNILVATRGCDSEALAPRDVLQRTIWHIPPSRSRTPAMGIGLDLSTNTFEQA
jgi:hypothetical protein